MINALEAYQAGLVFNPMAEHIEHNSTATQISEEERQNMAELYREHRGSVFSLSYRLLGSREAAEDATSEIFIRLQKALHEYDRTRPLRTWVMAITSHYCIDVLRSRQRERRVLVPDDPAIDVMSHGRSPLAIVADSENRQRVRDAVGRLPERYRVPLVLRYFADLSYEEIAQQMGLKKNHVATLLFRAKDELRGLLETTR